jgi:hypothetical protein
MGFLRSIVTDLVEKRLWPVAILLVLALAAVPVLLGRGAEPEPGPSAAAPAAPASTPAARAQIAVDVPVPANRERDGKLRNPFKQRGATAAAPATAPAPPIATAPSTTGTAPQAGNRDTSSGPAIADPGPPAVDVTPPGPTPPAEPAEPDAAAPKADSLDAYRISLRFGRTGKVTTRRDLARLTPLPTVDNPFFVFLGVLEGGKRAVFLVSADAKPTGDGVCKPRPADCQTLELRVGDTEYFDIARAEGTVQYELELVSIRKEGAGSASEAVAARARASKAGGKVLTGAPADVVDGVDGYGFSPRTGLLVRTPVDSRAGADEDPAAEEPPAGAVDPAAAAAAASAGEQAPAVRRQDKRTRAAVRAVVRGVLASLPRRR